MTNACPDLRDVASIPAETAARDLSESAQIEPSQPVAEAGFVFSLLDSSATITCACGARVDGTITTLGYYLPSDGWNYPAEGDPAEIDCERDCPTCGADLRPTVEKACDAIYREAHR